jgi:lipopolysaccharide export system protein LptA
MPLPVYRLRRWLAVTAVLFVAVVAGMYFYARSKALNVLKQIPSKIGIDIKQTARGFQFSKSDGKRTLFTIEASDLKEFKLNGRTELHNVSIVLYGRDSARFDQIYGDEFAYDPSTGDIRATGDVQIDLEANPEGLANPDQTTPKELKNPIHLTTRDLVFNRETGNASTEARVEFSAPQAMGWAVGVKYESKANLLSLQSQIHVVVNGPSAATIEASHATVTNEPRQIVLDNPRVRGASGTLQADRSVFYLGAQNEVQRILATGNVAAETRAVKGKTLGANTHVTKQVANRGKAVAQDSPSEIHARADRTEFLLTGTRDLLRTATLTGNVHIEQTGTQPMQGEAGRVVLDFAGESQLRTVHASEGVRLTQTAEEKEAAPSNARAQDFELTSSTVDFTVAQGHILSRAVTGGAARMVLASGQGPASSSLNSTSPSPHSQAPQHTVVTAGKFEANFVHNDQARNRLSNIHGEPDARIVSSTTGQPDRVSTSKTVDAVFLPQGGIESIVQQGDVQYSDGQVPARRLQAFADKARYLPSDEVLTLTGNPRITEGGMATTANTLRINRANGDALAEGTVKSTYSELKEQPNGGLLASSSPIHVTAQRMTAQSSPTIALYSGRARLWQDANIIEAPSIQFDKDRRFVTANGTTAEPVQTILFQAAKAGADANSKPENKSVQQAEKEKKKAPNLGGSSPIVITAAQLTYADSDRKAHYDGGVVAKGTDFTASAKTVDAYLLPRSQTAANQSLVGTGQLDRMEANGSVLIQQNSRHAEGDKLIYTVADDKFVLTGGPPSIFDAEQGKITGVSLTFFRSDDRVLVEGKASTPVVTQTRVAR